MSPLLTEAGRGGALQGWRGAWGPSGGGALHHFWITDPNGRAEPSPATQTGRQLLCGQLGEGRGLPTPLERHSHVSRRRPHLTSPGGRGTCTR